MDEISETKRMKMDEISESKRMKMDESDRELIRLKNTVIFYKYKLISLEKEKKIWTDLGETNEIINKDIIQISKEMITSKNDLNIHLNKKFNPKYLDNFSYQEVEKQISSVISKIQNSNRELAESKKKLDEKFREDQIEYCSEIKKLEGIKKEIMKSNTIDYDIEFICLQEEKLSNC